MLKDNHNRPLNYLRLAVTDRCNLRCFYCMPEKGVNFLSRNHILSYEEMLRLTSILARMGVNKIRITGGEPFVRKDMDYFLRQLSQINGIQKIGITTNGVLTEAYIPLLKELGINDINLSLDTLSADKFFKITRRNEFDKVYKTMLSLMKEQFKLKINMVVMQAENTDDILSMASLAEKYPLEMRYIEEMPFNGSGELQNKLHWNQQKIFNKLQSKYPDLKPINSGVNATAQLYTSKQLKGNIGIIAAFSRTFCGTCNRIRITAKGELKTCLYDDGVLDLRALLRNNSSDTVIVNAFKSAFNNRAKDGFEAEKRRTKGAVSESMTTIGG